jgi:hypothetical protein
MMSGSTTSDLEGREHEEASPQAYTLHTGEQQIHIHSSIFKKNMILGRPMALQLGLKAMVDTSKVIHTHPYS